MPFLPQRLQAVCESCSFASLQVGSTCPRRLLVLLPVPWSSDLVVVHGLAVLYPTGHVNGLLWIGDSVAVQRARQFLGRPHFVRLETETVTQLRVTDTLVGVGLLRRIFVRLRGLLQSANSRL